MAIFTDNVRQVEAPSNSQLTLALAKAIGENNVGKALGDTFKDFAGLTHDYTYGTSMGIANDIKKARDLLGAAKDENGLFLNSNDKVQELLRAQNPNWTANNYADANMEAWLKEREGEGRALEKLKLDKEAGGRDQQRVDIAKRQLAIQEQKYQEEKMANQLMAEYQEILKKSPDLVPSWISNNKSRLQASPFAFKQIMTDIAGNSNINMVPFSNGDVGQIQLANEATVTDALNEVTARENLNNQGGFAKLIDPELETKGQSLDELLTEKLKSLSYDKDPGLAETFTTYFNRAATALKAAGASDKEAAALMRNADKEGFFRWNVNRYNEDALVDQWKEMNKVVGNTGKTQLQIRRNNARLLKQARETLATSEQNKAITTLNTEYTQRRMNIQQMLQAGQISQKDAYDALAVINNWYRKSIGTKQDDISRARGMISSSLK